MGNRMKRSNSTPEILQHDTEKQKITHQNTLQKISQKKREPPEKEGKTALPVYSSENQETPIQNYVIQENPKKRELGITECYSRTAEVVALPYQQGHDHDDTKLCFVGLTREEVLLRNKGSDLVSGLLNCKKLLSTGMLDGLKVRYVSAHRKDLHGIIKDSGVLCGCPQCKSSTVVNLTTFEQHAGSGAKRPADHIFMETVPFTLSVFVQRIKSRQIDEMREEIHDLLMCKGSGQVLNLQKKRHRIDGDDIALFKKKKHATKEEEPLGKKVKSDRRRGRPRKNQSCEEKEGTVEDDKCALCNDSHFCSNGFSDKTVIFCDQCEKQYHVGCLRNSHIADLTEEPQGKWFCHEKCRAFYEKMQQVVGIGTQYLEDDVYEKLASKSQFEENNDPCKCQVTWEIIHGNNKDERSGILIAESKRLFETGFSPIVDPVTKTELIPCMLNSSPDDKKNFQGMFCAVLCVNSEVVTSAVFRIFGEHLAELPLVATAFQSRGKGYFDALYTCFEGLLKRLHVKKLVLPAAIVVEGMWKNRFGFREMNSEEPLECPMLTFYGTKTLEKNLIAE